MSGPELLLQQDQKPSKHSISRTIGTGALAFATIFGITGCGLADRDHTTPAVSITALEREANIEEAKNWLEGYLHGQAEFNFDSELTEFEIARKIEARVLYAQAVDYGILNDQAFLDRLGSLGSFEIYNEYGNPIDYVPRNVFELLVLQSDSVLLRPKPSEPQSYQAEFEIASRLDQRIIELEASQLEASVNLAINELGRDSTTDEIATRALEIYETLN